MTIESESRLAHFLGAIGNRVTLIFTVAERILARDRVWVASICSVLLLQFALIVTHRPWLDEWQALQISVQSPDWQALLTNLRYEGHPPLWYLFLGGVTKILPEASLALPVVAGVLALITQSVILFAAPFSRFERLLIASSEFVLFEAMTISRSNTLGVAIAFVALAFWRDKRLPWLFIALLPMCDFLFGVVSLCLIWLRWKERRVWWLGFAVWLLLAGLAAWTVRPMPDMVPAEPIWNRSIQAAIWLEYLSTLGLPFQWKGLVPSWNNPPPLPLAALALIAFGALCWWETKERKDERWLLAGLTLLTLIFSVTVYPLAVRHLTIIAIALILLQWRRMILLPGTQSSVWFRAWLLVCALCGIVTSTANFAEPFDTAHLAAQKIRSLSLQHEAWVSYPSSSAQGLPVMTGILFERIDSDCVQDFIRWNSLTKINDLQDLHGYLQRKAQRDGRFYLLSKYALPADGKFLRLIAKIAPGYHDSAYNIFVVAPERQPSGRKLPRCNGPTLPFPTL